jgi:hypothetical protein
MALRPTARITRLDQVSITNGSVVLPARMWFSILDMLTKCCGS